MLQMTTGKILTLGNESLVTWSHILILFSFLAPCAPSRLVASKPPHTHLLILLEEGWEILIRSFPGKSPPGDCLHFERGFAGKTLFIPREWTFEVVKRTDLGILLVSLKSYPITDSVDILHVWYSTDHWCPHLHRVSRSSWNHIWNQIIGRQENHKSLSTLLNFLSLSPSPVRG